MKQFTDEDKEKMTPAFRTALNDTVLYLICQRCEVKIPNNYKLFETLMNIEDKSTNRGCKVRKNIYRNLERRFEVFCVV